MARPMNRPGRVLVAFFATIAILYGLVAIGGDWKPALGLDLQGGTRITLTAEGDPEDSSLEEAREIIDRRVNGSGVAEADVTTQSGQYIQVEIPGDTRRDLVEVVQRQAQLRFRLVGCSELDGRCGTQDPVVGQGPQDPTAGGNQQGTPGSQQGKQNRQQGNQGNQQGPKNRPATGFATDDTTAPADGSSQAPTTDPAAPSQEASEPADPTAPPAPKDDSERVQQLLAWQDNPSPADIQAYNAFQCPPGNDPDTVIPVDDVPDKPLVTCGYIEGEEEGDGYWAKFLLSATVVEGTELNSASAGIPPSSVGWAVQLDIGGKGEDAFEQISRALYTNDKQFAIVLDGEVISFPGFTSPITNGQAQITGDFSEAEANDLATSLKFGALPISFEDDATVETIGPSLAGNQLTAGMWAGGIGLLLVMIYCLFYYRGLGLVVLSSLVVAAAITYALVLLLAKTAGFTLTLPGIAGLIIAVGVTADSFILLFERIRDEMRDGKSMRVAVESGWRRARVTRLAANTVSLLSALVLYIFATGAVKGFGFALGLSTLIDLAVLFWFTRPMVVLLSRFTFFNGGGRWSGLSPETLGIDDRVPVGGKA
ncbi:protein translocase subunit SecD [Nocardioides sp. zg-DK7169]|uniref:protein translocase subunit SecD n=1 Tax=Nocardioides sp. zg-DK7169 TaxID=2736600 RepID=UPI0015579920|nr:protein translocase subunit SecD [Nocardioides sp. zg-DK7169]NPC96883.1 protein translocase subunit SecD [Nocardioides sp. zg-DK7169]